ncbi:hypothetical protein [Dactylosporangium sp. CA-233914]|uniref:hypothetical protein n=1 Tax=Dactylosporangium sp. CA-233914 TaxID=3239934 RepID=UPI003D8B4453
MRDQQIVGPIREDIAVDGYITKAPGSGEVPDRPPADRGKHEIERPSTVEGTGIPQDQVPAGANRHDPPLQGPTPDTPDASGPLPEQVTAHLREVPAARTLDGEITHKGDKEPIQASRRWHVEWTNSSHNTSNRRQRCYQRKARLINAFLDLADTITTPHSPIRQAWTLYRWDKRPARRP